MQHNLGRWLVIGGVLLICVAAAFVLWLYWPVVIAETQYRFFWEKQTTPSVKEIIAATTASDSASLPLMPVNQSFSITIPKLHISAPIIADVDSQNSQIYQRALQKGVAHAAGSSVPSASGTTFLFAHSSANQLIAQQYNAVFYLLNKMQRDDELLVYYNGSPYQYTVTKTQVVKPDEVSVLTQKSGPQQLVLMTCTPAGTTARRLLVYADLVPASEATPSAPLPEADPVLN